MTFDRTEYMRSWMRDWRKANPDKERGRKKVYYERHKPKVLASWQAWKESNPEKVRKQTVRRLQKLKQARIEVAGRACPTRCELCKAENDKLNFDHCHTTGKFRGWICSRCNLTLGLVNDDMKLLRKMVSYLKRR